MNATESQMMEPAEGQSPAAAQKTFLQQRLRSLDAYRGLIMITLAFTGFGLARTAANQLASPFQSAAGVVATVGAPYSQTTVTPAVADVTEKAPNFPLWETIHFQFDHVQWTGCGYWDLIQPSFMFMVGVAMAFSYAKRKEKGHSYGRMLGHAVWRSIVLVFLGIFLISNGRGSTSWSLMNVLTQIGLGYTFLFLFCRRSFLTQAIGAVSILIVTCLLYFCYQYFSSNAGIDLAVGAPEVGVSQAWAENHLKGIAPAWHKNANVGQAIDLVILNLLPRSQEFKFNRGGYQTINFLPSLATMLFGLMCGELLRRPMGAGRKILLLVLGGTLGLALGQALHVTGVCPLVKRIWTPSWALFSGGWCCLILATLYAVIDVVKFRWWSFPLIVVGVNSIAIYCMSQMLKPWTARALRTHLGSDVFALWGYPAQYIANWHNFEPFVQYTMIGLCFWLVCFWMYRQKLFVRI